MNDFRKMMHLEYKKKMVHILLEFVLDFIKNDVIHEDSEIIEKYAIDWVNTNCLPMGDFDQNEAIKEIKEWNKLNDYSIKP